MEEEYYSKGQVIDYVWQYSKYHGNLLSSCESIAKGNFGNGFASLIFLFNLTENIFKDRVKDYDSAFYQVINKLKREEILTNTETKFLNNENNSIRRLRNLLAHSNLAKYHLSYIEDGREVYYPLVENETCLKVYDMVSEVLFNIMLKVVSVDFEQGFDIKTDNKIAEIEINIKELTPEQILNFKGIDDVSSIPQWSSMNEVERYRLAENTGDVNTYTEMFKALFKAEIN
ncbi:hypothetical protein [Bacillus toyonensis]|uniref:hypothetical protein n=1 Tax=Bacillus toyonensis TaxID=155322 RepID=UPI000BFC2636|nr:hypothetical protein [Bacillus toyonensis]PHB46768.1 hypothetical protein COE91_25810 [Bacillus toyonensis]